MNIGIDIDGVLTDMERFVLDYGVKFCYENNIEYNINTNEYLCENIFGITEKQMEKIWNKYLEYYSTQYRIRNFAPEVIKKLKENNKIYIITARDDYGLPPELHGKMKDMVKKWLEDNNVQYDKLIFTGLDKVPYCLENKIDVMIEDAPKNIIEISKELPVICFDNPYNKDVCGDNIVRAYSWYDVLNKIEKQ